MRITVRKTDKNAKIKGLFRSTIKKTREAVAKGSVEDANAWLKKTIQALDKAAEKNVISKNAASRKKLRLNRFVKNAFIKKD